MTDLMELASRVEAATKPSRALDREIADALGFGPDETWERPQSTAEVFSMDEGSWIKNNRIRDSSRYTASIDDAESLVPEGAHYGLGHDTNGPMLGWAWVRVKTPSGWHEVHSPSKIGFRHAGPWPQSPALALTAAALRARAHQGAAHVDQ